MSVRNFTSESKFLIVYASETGQAKAISEEIADKAVEYGLKPLRFCMSLTDKRFSIEKETCVVFIVSTTGDGQPPSTAIKFFRRLNRNTLKENHLKSLNYALLALGDSNYLKFAAFGRQLEHRLEALSAKCFYSTGYGDDAYGIETGVDPWINDLWPALYKQLGLDFHPTNFVDCYNLQNIAKSSMSRMDSASNTVNCSQSEKNDCLATLPSLMKGIDLEKCHVPKLPSPLYQVRYNENNASNLNFCPIESALVVAASPLVKATLIAAKQLTLGDDVKDTLEFTFKFEDEIVEYDPGDSFGFICPNDEKEVDVLLTRLDLLDVADVPAELILCKSCPPKKKLPEHIPSVFSLRLLLLHHTEIRAVPKKILLRIFAEYAELEEERLCLLFLSSQEGSNYYADFIRKPSLCILDILFHYKSCKPPIEKIIEHLPPLKPRFYSVASSPLVDKSTFRIVFNVLKLKGSDGRVRDREGVCTGWFHRLSSDIAADSSLNLSDQLSALKLDDLHRTVFIYKRKNQLFRFPNDLQTSVIMVGPGTGIAPFIGYLQHREKLLQSSSDENIGETWLFYGCRYQERDYLYREELKRLVQGEVLQHLAVSHSRDSSASGKEPRYVHESIKIHAQKISDCIKSGGKIYVCGDAKHMVHDVQQAFIETLQIGFDVNEFEAKKVIESLQKEHKYVNDVWA